MPKRPHNDPIPEPQLTTGDIARYCHTGVTQVNRWIKNGELKAFKNPGGHYRVMRKDFRDFLERNGMPVIEEFFQETKKKKILVADDDDKLADMIADVLHSRLSEIEIKTVYDGYEALITAGNIIPDLVILDIRMPKVDGLEVCRRLRDNEAISPGLKILAMTAHTEAYDRNTVLAAGADDYLIKPIDMRTLLEHVNKLL